MKKISATTFALLFFSITTFAQSKSIELFELVRSLSIPSSATTNMLPWKDLAQTNAFMRWREKAPVKAGAMLQQSGVADALIEGKKFTCIDDIGGKKTSCQWALSVQGKAQGFDQYGISVSNFPVYEAGTEIKMLFPKNAASFKLLSKCIEGASYWVNLYEVKIPGRKTFWMISTYESMSATASQYESSGVANNFYVGFYFSRKMAEDNCTN